MNPVSGSMLCPGPQCSRRMTTKPTLRPTILIVEDNADQRETLAEMLTLAGYPVDRAENGQEALHRLQQPRLPGLILLDLFMPVMGGLEFLEQQRHDPFAALIPVIIVSAAAADMAYAASLGTAGHLSKPIDIQAMLHLIARYCG
jgi:two-component system, chemotaxis family, chemotaxis protein CheY